MITSSIFKSYDIRGIYPDELNEEAAYLIGRAFAVHTGARNAVMCRDARLSSPALFESFASGAASQGVQLHTIGQLPTECLYFAVARCGFDAGAMVTASHNPKAYNGFKMVRKHLNDINIVRGKDLIASIEPDVIKEETPFTINEKDILDDYVNYVCSLADMNAIKPSKIAVDASNGVAGKVLSKISGRLPVRMTALNFQPDGNFPNHSPNPLDEGAATQLADSIKKEHADFGVIFDGDADRMFLADEQGRLVPAETTLLLLAKLLLEKNPGAGIAYNAICSKAVREFVARWGGVPIRTPVGFVNVREGLLGGNGVAGGEVSGHYCFRDYFYMDSGMATFLMVLEALSKESRKVSEIVGELSPYAKFEMSFPAEDKDGIINSLKEKYVGGAQDLLDGVTMEYEDWWFNARPSNTEPLLRLTIEADTQALLEEKKGEIRNFIEPLS